MLVHCVGGRAVGAGWEAEEGSPELLLLRQEGSPAGLCPGTRNRRAVGSWSWERPTGQNSGKKLSRGTDEAL